MIESVVVAQAFAGVFPCKKMGIHKIALFFVKDGGQETIFILLPRRNAGVVERGRLEICWPALLARGFESLFLRQKPDGDAVRLFCCR